MTFPPSQLLSLYRSDVSSKAAFQVSTTCVIQTPNIPVALGRASTAEILSQTRIPKGQRATDPSQSSYEDARSS